MHPATPPAAVPNDLPWSDSFLVGFAPMDDTHREFVKVVAQLLSCPDSELGSVLEAFRSHATRHFQQENDWMTGSDFPGAQCHIDEHAAVLKSVEEVLELVTKGRHDIGRDLAGELARWFPSHADHLDSALAQWLVKRSTGGAPVVIRRNLDLLSR
jgi:hemerythrin